METARHRGLAAACLATGWLGLASAHAEESSAADAGAGPTETEPSPEETAEFEAAAAADLAGAPPPAAGPAKARPQTPDIAVILDVATAWFTEDDPLQGGAHDPATPGFTLQQVEMAIGHSVDPYLRFDAALVFSPAEGVDVEEAYATTLALPHQLQLRAGQFYTRFGRQNALHPHAWDFIDQPFTLTRLFGGEGSRAPGVELSWITPLPWYVELTAAAANATGDETARSFLGDADVDVEQPGQLLYTFTAEQFFELGPNLSLAWGLSWATGPNAEGGRSDIAGTDVYLKYRPITRQSHTVIAFTAEWFWRRRGAPAGVLVDDDGHASVLWRFAPRWVTALRWEYGVAADARTGGVLIDGLDPEWSGTRHRVTGQLTFHPTEFSRLRLQGSGDYAPWRPDPIYAVMLAVEVVVGAHGGHKF